MRKLTGLTVLLLELPFYPVKVSFYLEFSSTLLACLFKQSVKGGSTCLFGLEPVPTSLFLGFVQTVLKRALLELEEELVVLI